MKKCFKCGAEKEIDCFYRHPKMSDGRLGKCKECTKLDTRSSYRERIVQRKEYDRLRNKRPERRASNAERQRAIRVSSRDKYVARSAVQYAVRVGKLIPMPCEVCGDERVQGHHDDYSKPLDVRWLCFKHHKEVHGQVADSTDRARFRRAKSRPSQ